ncbi:MAG: hypothetical protein H7178_13620 [Chitinophagaceae bacterium]|nr:hypothetical protein [Chitinophagaceae bacterium]
MAVKLTLLVEDENAIFIKKYAKNNGTSMSSLFNNHIGVLRKIETYYKKNKQHPHAAKIAGIISSGNRNPLEALLDRKIKAEK